jgi:hypothetical protein
MNKIYWIGDAPELCDLSPKHRITDEFVDGKVQQAGMWGNMCPACHVTYGIGCGAGRGQRYRKQASGKWLKVEG